MTVSSPNPSAEGEHQAGVAACNHLVDRDLHVEGVAHRPRNVLDVVQADHFEIRALAASRRIELQTLS
jgi:hypothetical protein